MDASPTARLRAAGAGWLLMSHALVFLSPPCSSVLSLASFGLINTTSYSATQRDTHLASPLSSFTPSGTSPITSCFSLSSSSSSPRLGTPHKHVYRTTHTLSSSPCALVIIPNRPARLLVSTHTKTIHTADNWPCLLIISSRYPHNPLFVHDSPKPLQYIR